MAEQWYLYQENRQTGPLSREELFQKAATMSLKADAMVWNQEMTGWARADTVPGLLPLQQVAPPPHGSEGEAANQAAPRRAEHGSLLPPRGRFTKETSRSYALPQPGASNQEVKRGRGCLVYMASITVLLSALLLIALYFPPFSL